MENRAGFNKRKAEEDLPAPNKRIATVSGPACTSFLIETDSLHKRKAEEDLPAPNKRIATVSGPVRTSVLVETVLHLGLSVEAIVKKVSERVAREAEKEAPLHSGEKQKIMALATRVVEFYCDNAIGATQQLPQLDAFSRKVLLYICDDLSILALTYDLSSAILKHNVSMGKQKWCTVVTLRKELP